MMVEADDNTGRALAGGVGPLLLGNEWVTTRAGGLNRYLADLVSALEAAGARPTAVVVGETPGRNVIGVSEPSAGLLSRLLGMRRAAAGFADTTNVVDVHFALYALLPIYTTRLRRAPLVVHFQGPWADESRVGRGEDGVVVAAKRALERAVYRRAQAVVVLSQAFGNLVTELYGVDPSRVVVMPPGVDLERFTPGDRDDARKQFGLLDDAFVAVSVRRLDARMGLDILLAAWAKVQAEHPDAVLLIAGEGRERASLEAMRQRLPFPESVRLLGRVDDEKLIDLYRAADCSVVPTRALEGFGLITLESMACGTPPIVTDVAGLPDGVEGLDRSLVVAPDDVDALASRLLAAADGNLPTSDDCRKHAEGFSWETVAKDHIELYERASGGRVPKIAFVGHTAELSGGELALARLLPALKDIEPIVILGEDGPLVERLRSEGISVEVLPMKEGTRSFKRGSVSLGKIPFSALFSSLSYIWKLRQRLRSHQIDIVHTNTLKAALYGGFTGRLAGVPVIWHIRDRIADDYLPRFAVVLVQALARVLPNAIITNSKVTAATIRSAGTFAIIPSPVDTYNSVLAVLGSSSNPASLQRPFTVGLVGRLAPWKGQDLFLKAFAATFPDGNERALIVGSAMFGEDEWAATLEALVESLGIAERVEFVGFTDDVAAEYARMDVLVHASTLPEPFGQVVVEGMAAGVPVVAADTGGPSEVITDGTNGLLYKMGDATALAARLQQLYVDPTLRRSLVDAGLKRAEDFTAERTARQVEEVYKSVLRRRK